MGMNDPAEVYQGLLKENRLLQQRFKELMENLHERKQAEDALRQSEEHLRLITDNMVDLVMMMDTNAIFQYFTPSVTRLLGYKIEEVLGKKAFDFVHPDDCNNAINKFHEALKSGRGMSEIRIRHRNGHYVWMELVSKVFYTDNTDENGLIIGARDISERKLAESCLMENEGRLRTLVQAIPDLVWLKDVDGVYLACNKRFEDFFGAKEADILGKTDYDFLDKEIADFFRERDRMVMAANKPIANEEWVTFANDGYRGLFETIKTPMYDASGKLIGVLGIARDITARKQAEEGRRKLENQLIQAQKLEAIGTLAGGIAHDFNNILSGIIGYTELSMTMEQDCPKVYSNMEMVLTAAERAKDLVRQILTFSRKTEPEKKPTDLSALLNEVVKFMRASLPKTIDMQQNIDVGSHFVMADPTQLHQVFVNLCTNAGYAMKEKGGLLEIGMQETLINAEGLLPGQTLPTGHYAMLTVRDTGAGIPAENLGRIFEPYFTTKEKGEGTGLGLAVAHGIVKDLGGEIRVYSEVGTGTIFRIYLPLMRPVTEEAKIVDEVTLPGKGEKVLVIDDEKMVANLNKALLERLGYRVVAETDPVKAVERFRNEGESFDLVITDKTMPHMTGFDVAREISQINPHISIILSSGFQEKGDTEKFTALGIKKMISKPIRISTLSQIIREILDER